MEHHHNIIAAMYRFVGLTARDHAVREGGGGGGVVTNICNVKNVSRLLVDLT